MFRPGTTRKTWIADPGLGLISIKTTVEAMVSKEACEVAGTCRKDYCLSVVFPW